MCHRNTTEEYVFHYTPAAEHDDPEREAPEGDREERRGESQVRAADD